MNRIKFCKNHNLGYMRLPQTGLGARKGTLCVYAISNKRDNRMTVYAVDSANTKRNQVKVVLELSLYNSKKNSNCYKVGTVKTDSKYQGFGVAPWVYATLIKKIPNFSLRTSESHSPGGRYIWAELAKRKDINVYAMTKGGKWYPLAVDTDIKEVYFDKFDIYERENIRLIAEPVS